MLSPRATAEDLDLPTLRVFELHPPTVNRLPVPISIFDDEIPEEEERLTIRLELEPHYDLGDMPGVFIDIIDNDRKYIQPEVCEILYTLLCDYTHQSRL